MTQDKKINVYLLIVLATMLILPLACILGEVLLKKIPFSVALAGKYFIFWAIGIRLFVAGVKQTIQPRFTAAEIFGIQNSEESFVIIRELGFANICMGLMGILSFFINEWRPIAAITGGLYFGLAGIQHVVKKADSGNEVIAMISDLFLFGLMLTYLLFILLRNVSPA